MNKKFLLTSVAATALLVGPVFSNEAKAFDVSLQEKMERIANIVSVSPSEPPVVVLQPARVIEEVTPVVIVKKPAPKSVVIVVKKVLPPPPPPGRDAAERC